MHCLKRIVFYWGFAVALAACVPAVKPQESRTDEEIQAVFDRNKAALYSIYQRSLRDNPGLSGHISLSIVIEPSGKVLSCAVSKSTLNHPELERQIAARIRFFDFGAKNTGRITITYPIDFLAK